VTKTLTKTLLVNLQISNNNTILNIKSKHDKQFVRGVPFTTTTTKSKIYQVGLQSFNFGILLFVQPLYVFGLDLQSLPQFFQRILQTFFSDLSGPEKKQIFYLD
jgi:hypothetical protein